MDQHLGPQSQLLVGPGGLPPLLFTRSVLLGQGLSNPHDIAVSVDGNEVYVAEIGPNKLWKFVHGE